MKNSSEMAPLGKLSVFTDAAWCDSLPAKMEGRTPTTELIFQIAFEQTAAQNASLFWHLLQKLLALLTISESVKWI